MPTFLDALAYMFALGLLCLVLVSFVDIFRHRPRHAERERSHRRPESSDAPNGR